MQGLLLLTTPRPRWLPSRCSSWVSSRGSGLDLLPGRDIKARCYYFLSFGKSCGYSWQCLAGFIHTVLIGRDLETRGAGPDSEEEPQIWNNNRYLCPYISLERKKKKTHSRHSGRIFYPILPDRKANEFFRMLVKPFKGTVSSIPPWGETEFLNSETRLSETEFMTGSIWEVEIRLNISLYTNHYKT